GVRILSLQPVETMLTQVSPYDGHHGVTSEGGDDTGFYCSYALATQQIPTPLPGCADDMGTHGATLVGHAGDAYGMKSGIWIDRAAHRGIAYFVTGVPEKAERDDRSAFTAAEARTFRRTYALLRR